MIKRRLSPKERLQVLDEVFVQGNKVSFVCRKWGISRFAFYKWAKNWRPSTNLKRERLLQDHLASGKSHFKSIKGKQEKLILECVLQNPHWSSHKINKFLNQYEGGIFKVSNHGAHTVLTRHGLNIRAAREEYKRKHLTHSVFPSRFSDFEKYRILEEFQKGKKIAQICREFYISRYTFYEWLKKYEKERTIASLTDQRPRRENHWRYVGETARQQVLDLVAKNPKYSVHRLQSHLAGVVGHHGIQNILWRENLNTFAKRQTFVQGLITQPRVPVAPLYEPQIPLFRLRQILAPFVTVPKLVITKPSVGLLILLLCLLPFLIISFWIRMVLSVPTPSILGLFFASIALTFGIFFFLYSLKYYLSVLMVLRLAQSGGNIQGTEGSDGSKGATGILAKIFGQSQNQRINPLLINLEKVELIHKPFVSIHVAVYNEKRVIERLIQACISQNWFCETPNSKLQTPNYEVIIIDDSTDETTELAKQVLVSSIKYQVSRVYYDDELETFSFTPPQGSSFPTVKLIHRFSRSGFKGGALQTALENTDLRAEYVCVFDSDFVPYPDTIEQFVKTFQVLTTNDQRLTTKANANEAALDVSPSALSDPIAAVQGYQWHVLNKSENWITRGVRTEYAGSYVIERASEEIYGGLKQIAGSVYAIRADILRQFGWGTSITEDFELTLRLYEAGYKVAFTPYIQAPAEAVSTVRRLIRQRMRWAEGASFNVKIMLSRMLFGHWESAESAKKPSSSIASLLHGSIVGEQTQKQFNNVNNETIEQLRKGKVWVPSRLTLAEKLEFLYLAPYYLQAAFFVIGTLSWFISEAILKTHLPFWTAALGWSLVFTNFLSLPLMNITGLFLEESEERDYLGILSFVVLSYIMVPFQAYAAIKGFLETQEGPWFRTPKTGVITDVVHKIRFYRWMGRLWPLKKPAVIPTFTIQPAFATVNHQLNSFYESKRRKLGPLANGIIVTLLIISITLGYLSPLIPERKDVSAASDVGALNVLTPQKSFAEEKLPLQETKEDKNKDQDKNQKPKKELLKIDPHGLKAVVFFSSLKIRIISSMNAGVFSLGIDLSKLKHPKIEAPQAIPKLNLASQSKEDQETMQVLKETFEPIYSPIKSFLEKKGDPSTPSTHSTSRSDSDESSDSKSSGQAGSGQVPLMSAGEVSPIFNGIVKKIFVNAFTVQAATKVNQSTLAPTPKAIIPLPSRSDNPNPVRKLSPFQKKEIFIKEKTSEKGTIILGFEKEVFQGQEEPTFKIVLAQKNNQTGILDIFQKYISRLFSVSAQEKDEIETEILDQAGNKTDIETTVAKLEDGEFEFTAEKRDSFKPGKFTLRVSVGDDTISQDFSWGVLTMNFNQSSYEVGQIVKIGMAVLDDGGATLCDADLNLTITDSRGEILTLTTQSKDIKVSDTCEDKRHTDKPDYYAEYSPQIVGEYKAELVANTKNGERQMEQTFEVNNGADFVITRPETSMRIYPVGNYDVNIVIKANKNFNGKVFETVPKSFEITNFGDGEIIQNNNQTQTISWPAGLIAGSETKISYTYKPPVVSPQFYLLDLEMKDSKEKVIFSEPRAWQIASDATYTCTTTTTGTWNWNTNNNWGASCGPSPGTYYPGYTGSPDVYNVAINVTGALTHIDLTASYTNIGTLSIANSTSGAKQLHLNSYQLSTSGAVAITQSTNAIINQINVDTGTLTVGTVSVPASITITGGTGARVALITVAATGTINLYGNLSFGAGTATNQQWYTAGAATINYTGTTIATGGAVSQAANTNNNFGGSNTINGAYTFQDITLNASSSLALGAALTVAGNWTNNSGTSALSGDYVVTMSGASMTIGGSYLTPFYGLTIANAATITLNTSATVGAGNFVFATGANASTFTHGSGIDLTVTGGVTMNQPSAAVTKNWLINAGTASVTGEIVMASTSTTATYIDQITITTGTLNANGGIDTSGATGGSTAAVHVIYMSGGTGTLNLKGAIQTVNAGDAAGWTFTMGTSGSNFIYDDTAAQTVYIPGAGVYNNLVIHNTNASGAALNAAITAANVTGNVVVGDDSIAALFKNGGLAIAGNAGASFIVHGNAAFEMSSSSAYPTGFGTFTFDATSTVRYLQSADATVVAATYGNLDLKPSNNNITLTLGSAGGQTITVAGNLTTGVNGAYTGAIIQADTYDPTFDINGTLTIGTDSEFRAQSGGTFTLGGNLTNNGTYTDNLGRITLDGNGGANNQTLNGSTATTTFYQFYITAGGTRTVYFTDSKIYAIADNGTVSFQGTASYTLTVTRAGSSDHWDLAVSNTGTTIDVDYTTASWSNATTKTMDVSGGTGNTDGLNNINWNFLSGINLSGTIYQTNESSAYLCQTSGSLTVQLRVNGAGSYSTTCTADSGAWSISSVTVTSGQTVAIYLDGGSVRGSHFLASDGTTKNDVHIFQSRLIVRDDVNGSITNTKIGTGEPGDAENDDLVTVSGGNLTVASGNELHVYTSDTFAPGGNVTTGGSGGNFHLDDGSVFTGGTTQDDVISDSVTIDTSATLTAPSTADDGTIAIGGSYTNNGTFTAGSGTVTFNDTSGSKTLSGTMTGSPGSSFYKVNFNGSGGGWTIGDAMKVDSLTANATDTFQVSAGTVTLGNGTGDNLEVSGGKFSVASGATFQTYDSLAQGDTITIDINHNSGPDDCSNCIISVSGNFYTDKNTTVRLNSYSSVQSGIEVESTGYLEIQGNQDVTGTSTSGTSETQIHDSSKTWSNDEHNNKVVRMTSGLAKYRIYTITGTVDNGGDDYITRADNSSANDTGSATYSSHVFTSTTSLISGNNEGVGRYLHNLTQDKWGKIIKTVDSGSNDQITIVDDPDTWAYSSGNNVEISDGVKSGDGYEILDYAAVTAQATNQGYIYLKSGSQTLIRYADISELGGDGYCSPPTTNKCGITAASVNGANSQEGMTIEKTEIYNSKNVYFYSSNNNTFNGNTYRNNDWRMLVDGSNSNSLDSNVFRNNGQDGIYITGSNRNRFSNNKVYDNGWGGVSVYASGYSIYYANEVYTEGFGFSIGANNIISSNEVYTSGGIGINMGSGSNSNILVGNKTDNNTNGVAISGSSGMVLVNDLLGSRVANTTSDLNFSTDAANTAKLYNVTMGSTTEVTGVDYSGAYVISRKHDTSNNATEIWGEYSIPSSVDETPQAEQTEQYNYSNNLWADSTTAHSYSGSGSEDTNLNYDLTGLTGGPYTYRLTTKTAGACGGASVFDVFRNETDVGDASCGTQFNDSSVGVKFTIDGGSPNPYVIGDTYTFVVWANSGNTNNQKTITMMQNGDTFTAGSGTTLELKGQSSGANRTTISANTGNYGFTVGGTIDALYYDFTGANTSGLNITSTASVTNLSDGSFDNFAATASYITVTSITSNKTWANLAFDPGGGDDATYNINADGSGITWDICLATGSLAGEDYDNEANGAIIGWPSDSAKCVSTSSASATSFSWQRKTFFETTNSVYWNFFYDGTQTVYYYSNDDGATWNLGGTILAGSGFSLWYAGGTTVYIVYYSSYDIMVNKGTTSTTSISWGTERIGTAFDGSGLNDYYYYPYVSRDSQGYLWVVARYSDCDAAANIQYCIRTVRSTNIDDQSTWDAVSTISDASNTSSNNWSVIVPLSSQNMYAIWIRGTTIEGKKYIEGSGWDSSPATIAASFSTTAYTFSAVSTIGSPDRVHLIYPQNSPEQAIYDQWNSSDDNWTSFSNVTLDSNSDNIYFTLSLDLSTSDLYAFWVRSDVIYYKKGVSPYNSVNWDTSATTFKSNGSIACVTSNYSGSSRVFVIWSQGTTNPYSVLWKYAIVPEKLLALLGFGPFLPLFLRRRKRKNND